VSEESTYREGEAGKIVERPLVTIKLQTVAKRYASGEISREDYENLSAYIIEDEMRVLRLRDESTWNLFMNYMMKALDIVVRNLPKPELKDNVREELKEYVKKYKREIFGKKILSWTDRDLEEKVELFVSAIIHCAGLATLKDLGYVK